MPFNFYEPKPLEEYDHPHGRRRRYWPYPKYLEHLDYTPEEVRSWGSIGHQADIHHVPPHREYTRKKCTIKCNDIKRVNHYYPEIYIRDRLTLENPGLLPALKNTVRVRDIPDKPITFVPPRFVHTNQRSQYHLLVREKDRSGLCEIARNLQQGQEKMIDMMRSSHIGRKMLLRAHASQTAAGKGKNGVQSVKSLSNNNKHEGRGKGNKKAVEGFFDSKIQLPIPSQIPKDVTQYIWSEEGGMESLCKTYPGKSVFVESPSNLPLAQHPEFAEMLLNGPPLMNAHNKSHAFGNQVLGNIKSPAAARKNTTDPIASKAYAEFNHYGLLEAAKNVALEHILKQLYRREPHVAVPKELLGTFYGALKGAPPGFKNDKAQIPNHLHENWYPEPEEMEKVERAIQYEKNLRKTRKAKGMQSQADVTSYLAQFTKPIITESWEDVKVRTYRRKSSAEAESLLERHDSSESLIYKVAEVMIEGEHPKHPCPLQSSEIIIPVEEEEDAEIPVITEEPEVIRKSFGEPSGEEEEEMDEEVEGGSEEELEAHEKSQLNLEEGQEGEAEEESTGSGEIEEEYADEVPSQFTLERLREMEQAQEELDDLSEFRDGGSLVVQDSSEFLPYPDVTFSMVALPAETMGVEKLGLYKKLAEDAQSVSSEDEEEEEEEEEQQKKVTVDDFFFDDDDDLDFDEQEEEEEETNEDDLPMVQVKSDTSMLLDDIFSKVNTFLTKPRSQSLTISRESKVSHHSEM